MPILPRRLHVFRQSKSDPTKCAYCGERPGAPASAHIDVARIELGDQLAAAARTAMDGERWILCATLCRAIEELNIDQAVSAGAAGALEAIRGDTVAMTMLGKGRYSCATCGVAGTLFERLVDVGTPSDPDATMPGPSRWVHLDAYGYEREAADGHPFKLPEQP